MKLYDHIDIARKFEPGAQSLEEAANTEAGKMALSLEMAKRLGEAKHAAPEEKRLAAMPVPN